MFITRSVHRRNALGEREGLGRLYGVNDEGLGIVVTQTTKFDPSYMKARFVYWLELAVNEMAQQARQEIQSAGFAVDEAAGERAKYRNASIAAMPFNEMAGKIQSVVANWSTEVHIPKTPSAVKTYGVMAAKLALSYVMPWVGLALTISTFVFKKKKKMAIPWNTVYGQALSFAKEQTVQEESNRIIEEMQRTQQLRVQAVEKMSQEGAVFKLPEYVTGIKRGALVMALKGQPVETKAKV